MKIKKNHVCSSHGYRNCRSCCGFKKNMAKTSESVCQPSERNIFKNIYLILFKKKETNGNMLIGAYSSILLFFFKILALVGFMISAFLFLKMFPLLANMEWLSIHTCFYNLLILVPYIISCILVFLFSVIFWGASNEVENIKDINILTAVFSSVVSLIALVVAILTFLKTFLKT